MIYLNTYRNYFKDTCNITITDMSNPDTIIEELVNVVSGKHLLYERKG